MTPKKKPAEHPNVKFDAAMRKKYLDSLRRGNLKFESARMCGINYRTVERRRDIDPEFVEFERHAMSEAREGIESVLMGMAQQGDLGAIKMWLTSHDKSTYGEKRTVELDATPAAVALGQAEAMARVAELQLTLSERRSALALDDGMIEAESSEVV